jgi:gamma-glutamyltranspeptidase/glutathione hydrolase
MSAAAPAPPAAFRWRPGVARRAGAVLLLVALLAAPARAASGGAVVSGEADATRVGLAVLAAGGNAVDAAVATALALAVVHPEAGNLGGGGFAVVRVGGEIAALDFRETAPAAATPRMFVDHRGEPLPEASLVGPLASGVPASPAGYFELHRRFGRLPWPRVVEPAIALARDGFEISARTARHLAEDRDRLARFPETAAVWLPGGRPPGWGERLRLPELAATLEAYAARGPEAITAGPVAAAIEAAARRHGGLLTRADLAGYRPVWRQPLRFESFGWSFASMPLPSSGGVLVAETLALLERLGWSRRGRDSADRAHLLAEALRRAFADRLLLGDPATTRATAATLLAPARLDELARGVDPARASRSSGPDSSGAAPEPAETTHLSVVDGDGNLVALTTTLNDLFGCRLWVPGAGFFLNDQMDDFVTAAGRPNEYGLVQGEANAVAPGKRPLSSMAPTLAWRGAEAIAIGGRGGPRIPTALLQVFLALHEGDGAAAAVARPRLHHQWLPDRLEIEDGALGAAARAELERRGHRLAPMSEVPKISLVARRADGALEAAGDPRGPEAGATTLATPEGRP